MQRYNTILAYTLIFCMMRFPIMQFSLIQLLDYILAMHKLVIFVVVESLTKMLISREIDIIMFLFFSFRLTDFYS